MSNEEPASNPRLSCRLRREVEGAEAVGTVETVVLSELTKDGCVSKLEFSDGKLISELFAQMSTESGESGTKRFLEGCCKYCWCWFCCIVLLECCCIVKE
jgi:hypothetical protein